MQIGSYNQELRRQIVTMLREHRTTNNNCSLRRPPVWTHVMCSNNQDPEYMVLDDEFDPRYFEQWIHIAKSNPDCKFRCSITYGATEYGDSTFHVTLEVQSLASDLQWFNKLLDLQPRSNKNLSADVYKRTGVFLTAEQIATIQDIAKSYNA